MHVPVEIFVSSMSTPYWPAGLITAYIFSLGFNRIHIFVYRHQDLQSTDSETPENNEYERSETAQDSPDTKSPRPRGLRSAPQVADLYNLADVFRYFSGRKSLFRRNSLGSVMEFIIV
jgi:hypothetical protein